MISSFLLSTESTVTVTFPFSFALTVVIRVAAQVLLWDRQGVVIVAWLIRALSLAKYQIDGQSFCTCVTLFAQFLTFIFLPARMVNLAMAMQAPLVKGHQWKTSMRQKLTVLMVR